MIKLKYCKRSWLNRLMRQLKTRNADDVNAFVLIHVKPQCDPSKYPYLVEDVDSFRKGEIDMEDMGTAFANALGFNVIKEFE